MGRRTGKAINALIAQRQEVALARLKKDRSYLAICNQQEKTYQELKELLQKSEQMHQILTERYLEEETSRTSFCLDEVYLQGLWDGFQFFYRMHDPANR